MPAAQPIPDEAERGQTAALTADPRQPARSLIVVADSQDRPRWTKSGRLTDAAQRELARLVMEGCGPKEISRRTGMPHSTVSHLVTRIAKTLGVPSKSERTRLAQKDIVDRFAAGQSRTRIASDLGIKRDRVDRTLQGSGLAIRRRTSITPDEDVEIERRICLGHPLVEIAKDLKCCVATVCVRSLRLKAAGAVRAVDERLCSCGWKHGHRGRCKMSPMEIATIRTRLYEGASMGMIARELDRRLSAIERHGEAILAQMASDGILCPCGKARGHRYSCTAFPSADTEKFRAKVRAGLDAGKTRIQIARELGRDPSVICAVANPILDAWAAEGRKCGCGKPINHRSSCPARTAGQERAKGGLGKLPLDEDGSTQRRILYRLSRGWPMRQIARHQEVPLSAVEVVAAAYEAALTASGKPLPNCRCGLSRAHRGRCQATPRTIKFLYGIEKSQLRPLRVDYRLGRSVSATSRLRNIGEGQIKRVFEHWATISKAKVGSCPCGLPGRHQGFCSARTRHRLPARLLARIDPMIRGGATVGEVAVALRIDFETVLGRSAAAREDLQRRGITCGCGRPLGHPYWCSVTWDRFEMPRGHVPLDHNLEGAISAALANGGLIATIARDNGVGAQTVLRVRRALPAADLDRRRRVMRERLALTEARHSKDLLQQIGNAVKGADRNYRDDIRNDIYLAVIEGRLEAEQIEDAAARMIKREWWREKGAPQSLDAHFGSDDDRTLHGQLGDHTASDAYDEMVLPVTAARLRLGAQAAPTTLLADQAALDVLELQPGATQAQAKAAWRRLAKLSHPDARPGDPEAVREFRLIQAAWDSFRHTKTEFTR